MLGLELTTRRQERAMAGRSHLYFFLFRPALKACEVLLETYKPWSEEWHILSEASAAGWGLIPPRSYSALLRSTLGILRPPNDSCFQQAIQIPENPYMLLRMRENRHTFLGNKEINMSTNLIEHKSQVN